MVDWDKMKVILEETKRLHLAGQLDAATFDAQFNKAINEAGAGRFVEAFFKYAPPEWIDQNVQLPLQLPQVA
jgi:hypothetical protein